MLTGAEFLARTPWERIAAGYDPDRMLAEEVYGVWGGPDELEDLRGYVTRTVAFHTAAAENSDAVLAWLW